MARGSGDTAKQHKGVMAWLIPMLFIIAFLCMLTGIGALIQVGFLGGVAAAGLAHTFPPIAGWLAANIVAPLGTQLVLILTSVAAWLSAGLLAELMEPFVWKTRIAANLKQIQTSVVQRQGLSICLTWISHKFSLTSTSPANPKTVSR